LYQQTTFEEPEEIETVPQPVPVGYYGRQNVQFQRRTGPEGEELAVAGPDGHLEELPPYTRYPTAGPIQTKVAHATNEPVSPVSSVGGPSTSTTPVVQFPTHSATSSPMIPFPTLSQHASPLIRQESIPMTPLTRQQSHQGTPIIAQQSYQGTPIIAQQSFQDIPLSSLHANPNPIAVNTENGNSSRGSGNPRGLTSSTSSLAEAKPDETGKGKRRRKQRYVCGVIPLWAILLVGFIAIFLAIIAGGVIGGLLSQQKGKTKDPKKDSNQPVTVVAGQASMWDAQMIPPPTNIPPLPTGTFFFPLGAAEEQQRNCLESGKDSLAWACNVLPTNLLLQFSRSGNYYTAKIVAPPMPNVPDGISYGPQPPRVQPPQKMVWVQDLTDSSRGPALHFQTVYDKIVILESEMFSTGVTKMAHTIWARSFDNVTEDSPLRKRHDPSGHALANTPGETPWYCYWNSTFIEGFIYVNQQISGAETQNFNAYTASRDSMYIPVSMKTHIFPTPTPTIPNARAAAHPTGDSDMEQLMMRRGISPRTSATSSTGSDAGVTVTVTATGASITGDHTFIPNLNPTTPGTPESAHHGRRSAHPEADPPNVDARRGDLYVQPSGGPGSPNRFPYIIKIEERRLPNPAFQPFCRQMRVTALGETEPLLDPSGNTRDVKLREAAGQNGDAQVTAGGAGHQMRPGGAAPTGSPSGGGWTGGVGSVGNEGGSGRSDGMGGWSKRAKMGKRSPVIRSAEFGFDENGKVKNLEKRKRDEPGNSCHCQWVTPWD
jgi:hypothetical protein